MCSVTRETYKFVSEPSERLRCLICYDLAEIPVQHEDCGKVFCKVCIDKNGNKPCPNCRSRNRNFFVDRRCAQEIADLRVRCDNKENGCLWVGTISTIEGHVKSCKFTLLPCPNNCTSLGKMWKEQLNRHLPVCPNRKFLCEYCGTKGTYTSIIKEHLKVCPKKQVPCVQCNVSVERGKVEEHIKVSCQNTVISCKYENIGCKVRMLRKDMTRHETGDNKAHCDVALEKLSLLTDEAVTLKYGESFAFKVSGFSQLKALKERFCSDPFYTCQRYKMRVLVDCNGSRNATGTHISVFIEILKGRYDNEVQWPFTGTVTYSLLNQIEDTCHMKGLVVVQASRYNAVVGSTIGISQFFPHLELSQGAERNARYLMDDMLHFRVHVDCLLVDRPWLAVGNVDRIAMKMAQTFKTIKKPEMFTIKLPRFSDSSSFICEFFVDPGYTAAISAHSSKVHLSIIGLVSKKPFGHSLETFSGTIQVELLNQLEDRNHHSRYLEECTTNTETESMIMKCTQFIPLTALPCNEGQNTQYLKDDTLFFRININANVKVKTPWLDSKDEFMKYYATAKKN